MLRGLPQEEPPNHPTVHLGRDDVSRVGQVRSFRTLEVEWCESTREKRYVPAGDYLLCFADKGYCKVFNLDDGRIYYLTCDTFDNEAELIG